MAGAGVGTLQGLRCRVAAKGARQNGKLAPMGLRQCRPVWQRSRPPPKSLQEPATKSPPPYPSHGCVFKAGEEMRRDAGASLRWIVVEGEVLGGGEGA